LLEKEVGYYHVSSVVDREAFKIETERRVRGLQKSLERLLKKFESDMQEEAIYIIYV
jgi:predicted transcriptional regulator